MHTSEVYASELKKTMNEGDALWFPEPAAGTGEIQVGDVGFIREGAFIRLFNVVDPDKYPVPNALEDDRLPDGFVPLQDRRAGVLDEREGAIVAGTYKSKSVVSRKAEATISGPTGAGGSAGAGLEYECTKEKGALLILKSDAKLAQANQEKTFEKYLATHYESWCSYATNLEYKDSEVKKLVLVRGWIKTYPDWSAAAFTSSGSKFRATVHASASGGGLTGSYSGEDAIQGPVRTRRGKMYLSRNSQTECPSAQNQCIFVKCVYYKPRRWPFFPFKAGAGPHQLPDQRDANFGHEDPVVPSSSDQEQTDFGAEDEEGSADAGIEAVLDYILAKPDVTVAVCNDRVLEDFLYGTEWPENMAVWIAERRPRVEVSSDGTGSLSLEEAIRSRIEAEIISGTGDVGTPPDGQESEVPPHNIEPDIIPGNNPLGRGEVLLAGQRERPIEWYHILFKEKEEDNGSVCMSLSADGKQIATTCDDAAVVVWEVRTGRAVARLEGHADTIWTIAFAPDGARLATGSADANAMIWNIVTSTPEITLNAHEGDVWCAAFSPDGSKLATGSTDCIMKVWDAHTGDLLHTLQGHDAHVMHVAFSPDGALLASCADATVVLWDAHTGQRRAELVGHEGTVWCMRFAHGSDRIVTGAEDATARVWDTASGAELVTLHEHASAVWCAAWAPDDSELATASAHAAVVASDSFSGAQVRVFGDADEDGSAVDSVAYSHRSDYFATGTASGLVRLWDAKAGEFLAEFRGHEDKVKSVTFTPDDGTLISSSEDGSVRAWSVRDVMRFF
ncbi:WD40 repeat domain-containing protein [Phanerochaete sordida]|uniref:WD40 repeat domain-containing protein n=1 Tax=Phanerochaete sordida TaxID=48140 RepID=A0A9P3G6V2_9APHY|nr:WD40 repeat domain-containing protein [Phanerochaete sordida]